MKNIPTYHPHKDKSIWDRTNYIFVGKILLSPSCQAVGSSGVLKVIQQAMDSWLSAPLIFNCEQIQAQILQNKTRNQKPRFPKHITSEEEY